MASGWTNRGRYKCLVIFVDNISVPTDYYLQLATNATPPTADINTFGQLTEIAPGNGYTSGGGTEGQLSPGTDFDNPTENDASDYASIEVVDVTWTAAGGPIPSSGAGARWGIFTDDNATIASREVYIYWDLGTDRSISAGQSLVIQDAQMRLSAP